MTTKRNYAESFSVGVIQTTLDFDAAWKDKAKMSIEEEEWAIYEIRKFIAALHQDRGRVGNKKVDVILLPELSIPNGFTENLRKMAHQLETIIIGGLDYRLEKTKERKEVTNEAIIIVPSRWRGKLIRPRTTVRYIGKTYAAPNEALKLKENGYTFKPAPDVWIFDGDQIGTFGVAICYDLLDLDRLAMYRGKIQHLFVLSFNRDITSFDHAAEAMARMIFCNVTICNCGYFGGSLSVSPYREPYLRTIYRHSGPSLSAAQVITLPVNSLVQHQLKPGKEFKNLPPGYRSSIFHAVKEEDV